MSGVAAARLSPWRILSGGQLFIANANYDQHMTISGTPCFACDAMLGGLARWLRAAGYDASWHPGIDDNDLVRLSQAEQRVLLSSDSGIFRIGIVRDGDIASLFIPRGKSIREQLAREPHRAMPLRLRRSCPYHLLALLCRLRRLQGSARGAADRRRSVGQSAPTPFWLQ